MAAFLILNAGSSSLKFAVYGEGLAEILRGEVAGIGSAPVFKAGAEKRVLDPAISFAAVQSLVMAWLAERGFAAPAFRAIGHRIVHGGTRFVAPEVIGPRELAELEALAPLAPLHLPAGIAAIRTMMELAPGIPNIGCFDTAFHAGQPAVAVRLALPRAYREKGYRRYGFHGLNFEHVVEAMPRISGRPLPQRLLAAHLGNGASLTAIVEGRSVATTMGYSTADGLVMGTRSGAIDPGVLIALMREGMDAHGLEDLLYRQSGLLGLSSISSDMRTLLASPDKAAAEAVESFCYWAARHAGSLIMAMGGIDAVVFTGGIGENAAPVRQRILAHMAWLGLAQDQVFIVPADEERTIARHMARLVRS
jgi:acetate kinase